MADGIPGSTATLRFFQAFFAHLRVPVEVTAHVPADRGQTTFKRSFRAGHEAAATEWVLSEYRGQAVSAAAYDVRRNQVAAIVKLLREDAVTLAFFPLEPTMVVQSQDALEAIWLIEPTDRWLAGSNPAHSLARRLGGRPAARVTVPGSAPWPATEPVKWIEASGRVYEPDQLREQLKQMRTRR